MAHEIEWIADPERFTSLADEWERMLPPDALPFDRHAWFEAWRVGFAPEGELAVCAARQNGELAAVFPLVRRRLGRLQAMANLHTPWFRPLGRDAAAVEAVARAALEASGGELDAIGLAAEDPALTLLEREANALGRSVFVERQHLSPLIDTRGELDDWVKETKPRWESNIPRLRRKMAREHDAHIELAAPPKDLERELDEGFRVEASGWKGRAGTAIASSEDAERFYRELARRFSERGELRLSRIVLDGEVVAFDYCLFDGRRLYLLKTGFEERFRKLAPGLVLRLSTIEHCFENGLDAHELLGDDAPWKHKFATSERLHQTLRAYSRGPAGRALHAYRARARPRLRGLYRRTLGRARS